MASSRDKLQAKYERFRSPSPIYSRWRIAPNGAVTRELMPGFLVRSRKVPEGYAIKDSPEDRENERQARERVTRTTAARVLPPAPVRLRPPPRSR